MIVSMKEKIKNEQVKLAYEYAIDSFGVAKFENNVSYNITSKELKKHFSNVYDAYYSYKISCYYLKDIKVYIDRTIIHSINTNLPVDLNSLTDSMLCKLFEERLALGHENIKGNRKIKCESGDYLGRKCN